MSWRRWEPVRWGWLLAGVAALGAAAPALGSDRVRVGRSVEGRAITAIRAGDADSPRKVLVVGCIHGDECAGVRVVRRLVARPPAGVDTWLVEAANPDGRARGTRGNARGVDLNRNFAFGWRPLGGPYYSGRKALSEPESRAMRALIRRVRPDVTIWFHQHLDMVVVPPRRGASRTAARRYARLSGLRPGSLPAYPGTATSWQQHAWPRAAAFVVELGRGRLSDRAAARHANAVRSVAR